MLQQTRNYSEALQYAKVCDKLREAMEGPWNVEVTLLNGTKVRGQIRQQTLNNAGDGITYSGELVLADTDTGEDIHIDMMHIADIVNV